jgi:hypothetical protein
LQVRYGVVAAVAAGMLAAGCGSSNESSSEASKDETATPQQAIQEIAAVRKGLDEAIATYKSGDKSAADQQVGDTYLQHFELVEGPLGKADKELNEQLEDGIREELRGLIKDGAPEAQVVQLHREIAAELDKAEAALR